jgi:hypothetical protein
VVARHLDDVGPRRTDVRKRPSNAAECLAYLHFGTVRENPVFVTADVPRDEHKSAIPQGGRVPQFRRAVVRQARFAIAHVVEYEAAADPAICIFLDRCVRGQRSVPWAGVRLDRDPIRFGTFPAPVRWPRRGADDLRS